MVQQKRHPLRVPFILIPPHKNSAIILQMLAMPAGSYQKESARTTEQRLGQTLPDDLMRHVLGARQERRRVQAILLRANGQHDNLPRNTRGDAENGLVLHGLSPSDEHTLIGYKTASDCRPQR